jgi:hypothetical protein
LIVTDVVLTGVTGRGGDDVLTGVTEYGLAMGIGCPRSRLHHAPARRLI